MGSTKAEICNLALSHLGVGNEILQFDTELSEEARACRRFFDLCRDTVLKDFAWPFATMNYTLVELEEDPTTEWDYSYRYPTDCLVLRKILSAIRTDYRESRVPYRIAQDAQGRVIYTDCEDAVCEYTSEMTDSTKFPPDFVMALSYKLAGYIAPRLTGGDPYELQQRMLSLYTLELTQAKRMAFNEEQPDVEDNEFIRARS